MSHNTDNPLQRSTQTPLQGALNMDMQDTDTHESNTWDAEHLMGQGDTG